MKKHLYYFLILLVVGMSSCKKDNTISEVPPGVIPADLDTLLAQRLSVLLPQKNNMVEHPGLFADTIQKELVLIKDAEVYVTFLEEGAFYENTFGYYTYTKGSPPASSGEIKKQILFPNVSHPPLSNGDKIQVGDQKFPAGTVIGFFLIVKGWQNGSINYNGLTLYTDQQLNPNHYQQHILFRDGQYHNIVLGFEDIVQDDTSNPSQDNDFNDVLFSLSDNIKLLKTTSFDTTKMATF